jgi:ParB/RepB/Spo0J family partition protein
MNATEIVLVPLSKLKLSPLNVRQQPPSDDDMAELAASIEAHGLKQNLAIHKVGREFHVHAGGRRLHVLKTMQAKGKLPKNYEVPCLVESKDEAEETSLIENFARAKVHAIDEFLAFDRLLKKGHSLEVVANRFGVTVRFVEGRMRLARLSPKILDAFREDQLDLDEVKAYTLTDDHARQEEVFEREGRYSSVWRIKSALSENKVTGSSPRARFIDHAAYEAAGGTITRDLFSDDDTIMFDDPALVDKLAMEKLQEKRTNSRPNGNGPMSCSPFPMMPSVHTAASIPSLSPFPTSLPPSRRRSRRASGSSTQSTKGNGPMSSTRNSTAFTSATRKSATARNSPTRPTRRPSPATAEHYWNRVKKGYALKVAGEQIGTAWSDDYAKDNKAQIAEAMERAFGDHPQKTAGLTADVATRTSTWLPDGMAFTGEYVERKNHHLPYGSTSDDDEVDPDADLEIDGETNDGSIVDNLTDNGPDSLDGDDSHDGDGGDDDDGDIPAFLKDAAE